MNSLTGVSIEETETFTKAVKKLQKRFKHIESDCDKFMETMNTTDDLGVDLGNGIYKVRIPIVIKRVVKVQAIDLYPI